MHMDRARDLISMSKGDQGLSLQHGSADNNWIKHCGNTFNTTTTSQTADSRLCDACENVLLLSSVFCFTEALALTLTRH